MVSIIAKKIIVLSNGMPFLVMGLNIPVLLILDFYQQYYI